MCITKIPSIEKMLGSIEEIKKNISVFKKKKTNLIQNLLFNDQLGKLLLQNSPAV